MKKMYEKWKKCKTKTYNINLTQEKEVNYQEQVLLQKSIFENCSQCSPDDDLTEVRIFKREVKET